MVVAELACPEQSRRVEAHMLIRVCTGTGVRSTKIEKYSSIYYNINFHTFHPKGYNKLINGDV
jgi:hypothetical protein